MLKQIEKQYLDLCFYSVVLYMATFGTYIKANLVDKNYQWKEKNTSVNIGASAGGNKKVKTRLYTTYTVKLSCVHL